MKWPIASVPARAPCTKEWKNCARLSSFTLGGDFLEHQKIVEVTGCARVVARVLHGAQLPPHCQDCQPTRSPGPGRQPPSARSARTAHRAHVAQGESRFLKGGAVSFQRQPAVVVSLLQEQGHAAWSAHAT